MIQMVYLHSLQSFYIPSITIQEVFYVFYMF